MEKLEKLMMMVLIVGIFLVPVISIAGSLEPSAAPAPTMKTLDQIPPTWSEKITTGRFVDALGGNAVLDKETGLVWEKSPSATNRTWNGAGSICPLMTVGNRKGWRLPTVEELSSLVDPLVSPALPAGHPFSNVNVLSTDWYWSATTPVSNTASAWLVTFFDGSVTFDAKTMTMKVWCVRGGPGFDGF